MDRLKILIRTALNAIGLDLIPAHKGSYYARRRLMHRVSPSLVLDVGANTGQYGLALRASGYCESIVSFEPLQHPFRILETRTSSDPKWRCVRAAAGDRDQSIEMYVAANSVSSSLREIERQHVEAEPRSGTVGTEMVRVVRIDGMSDEVIPPSARIWMKIDVQGFESEVLAGTQARMHQVVALELELSIAPMYKGQRLLAEMLPILDGLGFRLVWLDRVFVDKRSAELLQVDGMFLRKS